MALDKRYVVRMDGKLVGVYNTKTQALRSKRMIGRRLIRQLKIKTISAKKLGRIVY